MPGYSGVTGVTTLVCFFILHARLRARRSARHSLRPLILRARFNQKLERMRRGRETASANHHSISSRQKEGLRMERNDWAVLRVVGRSANGPSGLMQFPGAER